LTTLTLAVPGLENLQVTQLSLTNPRDAVHYGKQQNFKTIT